MRYLSVISKRRTVTRGGAGYLRLIFLLFGLVALQALFNAGEARAAIARVGGGGTASGTAVTTLNVTIPATTAGNTLVAVIGTNKQGTNGVSAISGGGTWTRVTGASGTNAGGSISHEVWYCPNITAGVTTVAITVGTWDTAAVVQEYSGVLTASPLDASAINNAGAQGTALTSGSATATTADLGIAGFSTSANTTFTGPATGNWNKNLGVSRANVSTMMADNLVVSAGAATTSTTAGASGWWVGSVALFKAASTANLTVGNGTNPANVTAYTGSTGNAIDAFTLAMSSGTATVSSLTLTGSTNFTATNIKNITVYRDTGTTVGTLDGSDVLVSSSYTLSGTVATITLTSTESLSATAANYMVVVDIQSGGTPGNTMTATITGATGTGIGTPAYSDSSSATLTLATGTTTVGEGTNPASANPIPGSTGNAIDSFTLVKSAGSGTVSTITFTGSAQFTSANVSSVKLYRDNGTTVGTLDGSDTIIATTTAWSTNVATLTLTTPETVSTSAVNYLVVVDLAAGATVGNTLSGTISALSGTGLGTVTDSDASSATLTITSPGYLTVGNGATISAANVQQGSTTNIMDSFTLAMSSASATVSTLTLTGSAQFTSANVANISIYSDNSNPQGAIGGSDAVIPTTVSWASNVATITFTTPESVTTTAKNYLVVVDIKNTATVGNTLSGTITAATGTSLGTPTYSDTASGTLTVTAGTCVRTAPTVAFSPTSASIPQGNNLAYTLTVTNNDNVFCSASTFTIAIGSESGTAANFTLPSTLGSTTTGSLAYGATYNTTLTVTVPSSATVGTTNTTTVNITDATNHNTQSGSGSVISTVSLYAFDMSTLHNSNRFGTCSVTAYSGTSQATCTAQGGTWSATSKWTGNWGLSGGKYGPFSCATCHAPNSTNIKRVQTSFATPDGTNWSSNNAASVATTFTNVTSLARGMGDDTRSPNTSSSHVCEVCHSLNKYHNYNVANNTGGTSHNNGKDCTSCHSHKTGFLGKGHSFPYGGSVHMPAGTGSILSNTAPPYANCNGCHDTAANTGTYPVAAGTAPVCTSCHNPLNVAAASNHFNGTTPASGCWDCHGATQAATLTGATNSAPNGTAFPNRAGVHLNHLNGTYASASCSTCHTYGNGSVNHGWSNRTKSTDASASIGGSVSGWSPGTRAAGQGTCLTTNCSGKPHNDAASFHWY